MTAHQSKASRLWPLVVGLILLTALFFLASANSQAAPLRAGSLSVSPSAGPAGSSVTVSGSGWTNNNPNYIIYWDSQGGSQIGSFSVSDGSFSTSVTIPGGATPGGHSIVACEGVGGEFESCASTGFTVSEPATNTPPPPTNTPLPPTATFTASATYTPSATFTPSITPTPIPCEQELLQISPAEDGEDYGGVETLDLTVQAKLQGGDEPQVVFYLNDGRTVYTRWPDPLPGTTVEAEAVEGEDFTHRVTVRDYPIDRGRNRVKVEIVPSCGGLYTVQRQYFEFSNGVPFTPTPRPDACGGLGLGTEAEVLAFNSSSILNPDQQAEFGINFENTLVVERPVNVEPRSGHRAARSRYQAFEFGSETQAIRMSFRREGRGLRALGMFVGLDEATETSGQVTALLSVYGYLEGGESLEPLGTSSTTFPAEPTDIKECLTFEAAEGEIIARAVLNFVDEAGFSIVEDRWMDDLTLVYGEEELPPNEPPFIEILRPEDGAILVGDAPVRAEITEDIGLAAVRYQVDDGDWIETGFNPVPGEPALYTSGVTLGLSHDSSHVITMQAEDVIGQTWRDSVTINIATPEPTLDIEAVDAEVIQVVQCMRNLDCEDNSVPLLSGKPTMVRVYLRASGGPVEDSISGRLCRGSGSTCDSAFVRAINRVVPDAEPDPVRTDRSDIDASLNFMLPPSWVGSPGELDFIVHANYEGEDLPETSYRNNQVIKTIEIEPVRTINVMFTSMANGGTTASLNARWDLVDWLAQVFPVSEINPRVSVPNIIIGGYDLTETRGDGCGRGWNKLLGVLRDNYFWSGSGKAHLYGMVPGGTDTGDYVGCGARPGKVAAGIVTGDRGGGQIAAQEIGHNLGRRHPLGCDAGNTDGSYPVASGNLDAYGLDIGRLQVYPPGSSFDFMGYCGSTGNTWVSAYTYQALMRKLELANLPTGGPGVAAPAQTEHETFLVGSGYLTSTSFTLESGFFQVDMPAGTTDELPTGPFEVRLYGPEDEILYQRDFGLVELSKADTTSEGSVLLSLPALENAVEIVLLHQGTQLESIRASANPPSISLISPSADDSWDEGSEAIIEWRAEDPDGDPLSFNVQYSQDNGSSWHSIAPRLRQTRQFSLDPSSLPGGPTTFRVLASDGFHTAVATMGGELNVSSKAPQVHLSLPEDGFTYPAGEAVILRGFAVDLEDESLPSSAFSWSSDLDGELGTGQSLWGLELTPGDHQITLTVTDSDGQSASQSVRIEVLTRPEPEPGVRSRLPALPAISPVLLLIGLAALAVLGTTALVFGLRRRG